MARESGGTALCGIEISSLYWEGRKEVYVVMRLMEGKTKFQYTLTLRRSIAMKMDVYEGGD
jgi:hypothetical protein